MMDAYGRMIFSSILVLSLTAVVVSSVAVRAGDDVALSCENVIRDEDKCDGTAWVLVGSMKILPLFEYGQIHKGAKSDRLSVAENCSLVMKEVTDEDVGYYFCKQFESGRRQESHVYLSVVTMTEHQDAGNVTLNCSVSTFAVCGYRVKWLHEGQNVDEDQDMKTSQSKCSAAVTFPSSYLKNSKHHESFTCEVTELSTRRVQAFAFSRQSSGDEATTETTEVWWRLIIVSAGLSALMISVVTVNIWMRTKANKTQTDRNTQCNDEDEGTVVYENTGEPPVSIRLH